MKLKSVSGYLLYVKDIEKTLGFYEKLGCTVTKKEQNRGAVRLNWFFIEFVQAGNEEKFEFVKEASLEPRGSGVYFYASVDNVDAIYNEMVDAGLKPSSEPRDWPWGNREFVIRDPDGYKIVIFKKK